MLLATCGTFVAMLLHWHLARFFAGYQARREQASVYLSGTLPVAGPGYKVSEQPALADIRTLKQCSLARKKAPPSRRSRGAGPVRLAPKTRPGPDPHVVVSSLRPFSRRCCPRRREPQGCAMRRPMAGSNADSDRGWRPADSGSVASFPGEGALGVSRKPPGWRRPSRSVPRHRPEKAPLSRYRGFRTPIGPSLQPRRSITPVHACEDGAEGGAGAGGAPAGSPRVASAPGSPQATSRSLPAGVPPASVSSRPATRCQRLS